MGENDDKVSEKGKGSSEALEWLQAIIAGIIIVAFINTFFVRMLRIDGESMKPYFSAGERIITTEIHGELKYGDVVVIKRMDAVPLIKRVIATKGQVIDIDFEKNEVYVDSVLLDEPFIAEPTDRNMGMKFPATVPENCVFVMGDNRNYSDDSRSKKIGMIDERKIFGKVVFRVFPFDKFGSVSLEKAIAESKAPKTDE